MLVLRLDCVLLGIRARAVLLDKVVGARAHRTPRSPHTRVRAGCRAQARCAPRLPRAVCEQFLALVVQHKRVSVLIGRVLIRSGAFLVCWCHAGVGFCVTGLLTCLPACLCACLPVCLPATSGESSTAGGRRTKTSPVLYLLPPEGRQAFRCCTNWWMRQEGLCRRWTAAVGRTAPTVS